MSKVVDDALTEFLDLEVHENLPAVVKTESLLPVSQGEVGLSEEEKEDYVLSRNTLHNIIDKGNTILDDMMVLARETENARVYEVLATMMKTLSDSTKDLSELHKRTREIRVKKDTKVDETNISVDKAVFVGTTADLLRMKKEHNG
tara:strand:+ start:5694 stop:6131 length:438 start_codon:yes stop_codon:yes gene_type:complete